MATRGGLEKEIKEKLTKETGILDRYNYSSTGVFKELAVTGIIRVILHSL